VGVLSHALNSQLNILFILICTRLTCSLNKNTHTHNCIHLKNKYEYDNTYICCASNINTRGSCRFNSSKNKEGSFTRTFLCWVCALFSLGENVGTCAPIICMHLHSPPFNTLKLMKWSQRDPSVKGKLSYIRITTYSQWVKHLRGTNVHMYLHYDVFSLGQKWGKQKWEMRKIFFFFLFISFFYVTILFFVGMF